MDPTFMIIFEVIVSLASLVSGLTGFGFALVLAPGLMLMIDPKIAVPVVSFLSIFLDAFLFFSARKWAEPRKISPLMISGLMGMIVGILLLVFIDITVFKLAVSVLVILFSLAFLMNLHIEVRSTRPAMVLIGFVSGFLGGSTSMSGPPVVLFFSNQGYEKMVFRANLLAYFLVLYTLMLPGYWIGGLLTGDVLTLSALALPGMLIGSILGSKLVKRVKESQFKAIALILVLLTGFVTLVTSLHVI